MTDLVILGTDTDAGKSAFATLWLAAFGEEFTYWKPLESGSPGDTARLRESLPQARIHDPVLSFAEPVAPLLAARRCGAAIPSAAELAARKPGGPLLIETFGGPFSPLNERELQIEFIRALNAPSILVTSSTIGAIGRGLQSLTALQQVGIRPLAVVLIGPPDEFAVERLAKRIPAYSVELPSTFCASGVAECAGRQRVILEDIRHSLTPSPRHPVIPSSRHPVTPSPNHIWHPYTSLRDPDAPLQVVGAEREFLQLADGRRVIDGISSWWTILHGHRHPPLMAALHDAMRQIDHVHFAGVTHPWGEELAAFMLDTAPWPGGRVFYSDNGSTAVEVALKMAVQFWQLRGERRRTRFIGFEHGYHGDTFGAMAVGRDPLFFGRFEPLLCRADIVPLDANRLDETLAAAPGEYAAVIVEPLVQGAGGMRMHSPEHLQAIAKVTQRHDVLLIADEVMTGGGRVGPLWAHQSAGIAPDMICAAKTLAGGVLPLAATLVAPPIVAAFDTDDRAQTFFHGHSFTAHPLACAVAVANWRTLPRGTNPEAMRIESFWRESLGPLHGQRHIADVRIRGSIIAVELRAGGGYLADVGRELRRRCLEQDVLLRPLGNVLYAMPPLRTSDASLDQIATAIRWAIEPTSVE